MLKNFRIICFSIIASYYKESMSVEREYEKYTRWL